MKRPPPARPSRRAQTLRHLRRVYGYNRYLAGGRTLVERAASTAHVALKLLRRRRRVLFYPDLPNEAFVLHKICLVLGYEIVLHPDAPHDAVVKWPYGTYMPNDDVLRDLARCRPVLNYACTDISKSYVADAFREAFGYALDVDPLRHEGPLVCKSEANGQHDGRILHGPLDAREPGYTYQRLVRTQTEAGLYRDYRVPYYGGRIPFVYVKDLDEPLRLGRFVSARIEETDAVFSDDEQRRIADCCARLGLDYGELDVLRDRDDGRIYIVDVNNTPAGPSLLLSIEEGREAVRRLALAFADLLFPGTRPDTYPLHAPHEDPPWPLPSGRTRP